MHNLLVVIAGPTAIGKTKLAVDLALHYNSEILSADSRQFYKELNIGTAKPSPEEQKGITHHFIDSISIHEAFSAGKFEKECNNRLEKLFNQYPILFMVGGSGLYIDAVCNGFDEFTEISPIIRTELNNEYNAKGILFLQEKLRTLDPEYFSKVDKNNPHRLIRALEVCLASGKKYSDFKTGKLKKKNFSVVKLLINEERNTVYRNINKRVDEMIQKGLIEEAELVFPLKHLNALNTVGYKELFDHFEKKCSREEAIDKIKQNTRRFAKRQLTWFKKNADYIEFKPNDFYKIISYIDTVRQNM